MDNPIVELPPDLLMQPQSYTLNAPETWHLPRDTWDKIRKVNQGKGVKVAHLDTGIVKHPDLPTPLDQKSFISGESVEDRNSHGTHVVGSTLARDPNIGVASEADSMVYKVLSNGGSGSSSGIAAAINYAVDKGADVLSLSLGGPSRYEPTIDAIKRAISRGIIVCLAAGNSGFNGSTNTIGYPARAGFGVVVAALKEDYTPASFSSGGTQLTVAAPGQNILSTSNRGVGYIKMSGTSMATPIVAGYMALVVGIARSQGKPSMTSQEAITRFFEMNCKDLLNPGHDPRTGYGMFDAQDLVHRLSEDDIKLA